MLAASSLAGSESRAPNEQLAGGDTTVFDDSRNAFSHPAANLSVDRQSAFFIGNSLFKRNWVEAPASTTGRDGLGPHFIARSCGACHALDGRGAPPAASKGISTEPPVALLLRLSVPGSGDRHGVMREPTYGTQLNNAAISGMQPEGRVRVRYTETIGRFADGEAYRLRKPKYVIDRLTHGALDPRVRISPRVAPQIIGMGLLEAIREDDIVATAKQQPQEIAGRPNRVWDAFAQREVIGRFGWKANVGSVAHQVASAFNGDIGIASSRFPAEECTPRQTDCLQRQQQEVQWRRERGEARHDIDDQALDRVSFYASTIAVPARRNVNDATLLRGKEVFRDASCAGCHRPMHVTGELAGFPELSRQTIWPYTDLLLHDHTFFLHDGRARNLMEAVLWHGGQAESAKKRVLKLSKNDRAALVRFLESL